MLRTSSFFGPLNSGFVPFTSAAPVDALAEADPDVAEMESASAGAEAAEVVARAAAVPADEALARTAVEPWAPASSARIRVVEGVVVAAICAYFGWALLRTFAVF